ncbi:MAG: hypothetical protein RLZZ396_2140, partial [Planctomycetota bacterium]
MNTPCKSSCKSYCRATAIGLGLITVCITGERIYQGFAQHAAVIELMQIDGCKVLYDGAKDLPLHTFEKSGRPSLVHDLLGRCVSVTISLDRIERVLPTLKRLPFLRQCVVKKPMDDPRETRLVLKQLSEELAPVAIIL